MSVHVKYNAFCARVNGNKVLAKLEYLNPFSQSVKDRPAAYMLTGPLERGEIDPREEKI